MVPQESETVTIVSAPGGRRAILVAIGICAVLSTVFLVIYLVSPQTMGPSPDRPNADSLTEVFVFFLVSWSLAAFLWAVIDREVSVQGDRILIVRGTGQRASLPRADVKAVHAFPFRKWYVMWMSCVKGAPIGRSIFFSNSPELPDPQ